MSQLRAVIATFKPAALSSYFCAKCAAIKRSLLYTFISALKSAICSTCRGPDFNAELNTIDTAYAATSCCANVFAIKPTHIAAIATAICAADVQAFYFTILQSFHATICPAFEHSD